MATPLPSGDPLERFRRALTALAVEAPVAVAVSGGGDSLALLLLTAAAMPGLVHAATVNHGLRAEAASEADFVAQVCSTLGVPHRTLSVAVKAGGAGRQGEARTARYAALAGWMVSEGVSTLLTGHHADDQAETLLMRLQRGSGVRGLAGVRASGPLPGSGGALQVARPLLGWRRAELAELVAAAGLQPVEDPSNRDPAFDRVRMRQWLAGSDWLDVSALAKSAAALADADEALDTVATGLFEERASGRAPLVLDPDGVPSELLRRLVVRCLAAVAPDAEPRGDQVTVLVASLRDGAVATLAGVKCSGGRLWRFERAPPRRSG
jgi:tRNA(Ile)-lysidine synthase